MGLVSFELATVFLGGHNSLSQAETWKCRGYVSLWVYSDVGTIITRSRLGYLVLTTFYFNVQLLDCVISTPDRVLE
jgi:hypothetical protein